MKLILLPGLDGSGNLFDRFIRVLPPSIQYQICPLPEQGPQDFPSLVTEVSKSIPAGEDFVILAESFSGRLGLELSYRFPERAKGLVLVSSFLTAPGPIVAATRFLPLEAAPWHWAPALAFRYLCLGRDSAPELVREVQRTVRKTSSQTIGARIKVLANLNEPEKVSNVPCLYLRSTNDRLVPKDHVEAIRRWCPNLRVTEVAGPHLLLQARPEQCVTAITGFVNSLAASGEGNVSVNSN